MPLFGDTSLIYLLAVALPRICVDRSDYISGKRIAYLTAREVPSPTRDVVLSCRYVYAL